jgi:hypothetical protein
MIAKKRRNVKGAIDGALILAPIIALDNTSNFLYPSISHHS